MVFGDINWLDPALWIWAAVLIVILIFLGIFFKIILGKREPRD